MKKCVAYCRVSTAKDDQKNSIEAQKAYYLNKFKSEGYNPADVGFLYKKGGNKEQLTGIFADEGISGTSLKNRNAFNAMIEYAKKGAFDIIYVKDISRFTRSVEDGTKTLKDLKEVGVGVIFEDSNINSLDSSGEFEINLRMMLAQEESRNKSDRVKWGMMRLFERGGWNGAPPYGYDNIGGNLVINVGEAEIVKKVYQLFQDGCGTGKIARYLNNNNIKTRTGVQWSQTQVMRILENEIYKGIQRNHTVEMIDINRHLQVDVEEDEHIVHKKAELVIIEEQIFDAVQVERERRIGLLTKNTHHSNAHLLSGLIYCSHCGGNFKRKKRHSYTRKDGTTKDIGYEWTCAINDMYGKSRCGHRNMLIEAEFIEDIKAEILKLKNCDLSGHFQLYMLVNFDYDISTEQLDLLRKRRDRVKTNIMQLREEFSDNIISKELYRESLSIYSKDLGQIEAEINQIEQHDLEVENAKRRYEQYISYIQSIDVNNLTNAILKNVFSSIKIKSINVKSDKNAKMIVYDYKLFDMGLEELINKATEKGLCFSIKDLSVSF